MVRRQTVWLDQKTKKQKKIRSKKYALDIRGSPPTQIIKQTNLTVDISGVIFLKDGFAVIGERETERERDRQTERDKRDGEKKEGEKSFVLTFKSRLRSSWFGVVPWQLFSFLYLSFDWNLRVDGALPLPTDCHAPLQSKFFMRPLPVRQPRREDSAFYSNPVT